MILAVVPAHFMVDFDALRALAGAQTIRLALEQEFAALYPDCEPGAIPAIGHRPGQRVFVDKTLVGEPEMTFNAGTHTDSLCMHYSDFAEIVRPTVATFSTPRRDERRRVLRYRVRRRIESV